MPFVTFRISMGWNNRNIENAWHNTMEFEYLGDVDFAAVQTAFNPLVTAWQGIHLPVVQFLQYTVSTYAEDSEPYNPASFVTVPLDTVGTRSVPSAQPLAENECYWIRKQPSFGRVGKLYLRGVLTETDVEVRSDGKFVISASSSLRPAGADWDAFYTAMEPYLTVENTTTLVMLRNLPSLGPERRYVNQLVPSGVKDVNPNHKWFNRSASTFGGA